jgi:hypothetical protein
MSSERLMRIHSPEFQAMAARVLEVTALTSRLNALPFEDEEGRSSLLEQILGRSLPDRLTVYPPFFTDHGLNLELGERVFINQNCTFLDYAGIRIGNRTMIGPKVTFITNGHPVDRGAARLPHGSTDHRGGERVDRRRRHDPARRHDRSRRRDRGRSDRSRRRARREPGDRREGDRAPQLVTRIRPAVSARAGASSTAPKHRICMDARGRLRCRSR